MFGREEITSQGAETIIGPSVNVEGDFVAAGDVIVEGNVSGNLKTDKYLQIGENAKITANISAGSSRIAGEVHGNLFIKDNLDITSTAKIFGDIRTKVLSVAAGAIIQGKCNVGEEMHHKPDKIDKVVKEKNIKSKEMKVIEEAFKTRM